ncbi:hypothetical protein MYCTH_2109123 [Thermothelomyces thermophilus ATCC 42464]|uniref:Phosphoglycerate mutase-like protein n=1 Tax=Thermothelomyces thermophilus (strain ATCC 42464 / BCRC 31852 / DSM 1799) TaxID=573729 RepID=G2QA28_THET4|nr:uncharacterized protein MYCTH_2109123 [Thermothelomyces thermophilus ATCC 42464]AEO56632.1 hypothetical protein MYCTH_2109123 [Thermothelomyces thermophilus ATCC 42464]
MEITERLDRLISRIREIQMPYMNGAKPADVLIFAHGLVLRCFIMRWLGFSVDFPLQMKMDPGAIAVLRYNTTTRSAISKTTSGGAPSVGRHRLEAAVRADAGAGERERFARWSREDGVAGGGYWNDYYDIEKMDSSYAKYGAVLTDIFPSS